MLFAFEFSVQFNWIIYFHHNLLYTPPSTFQLINSTPLPCSLSKTPGVIPKNSDNLCVTRLSYFISVSGIRHFLKLGIHFCC